MKMSQGMTIHEVDYIQTTNTFEKNFAVKILQMVRNKQLSTTTGKVIYEY